MGLRNRFVRALPAAIPGKAGTLLDESLSYPISTVRVSNYSGHWLRVEPDGYYVPPYIDGDIIDLFVAAQRVRIFNEVPPGVKLSQTRQAPGGTVIVSMYDEAIYPSPGRDVATPDGFVPYGIDKTEPGGEIGGADFDGPLNLQRIGVATSFPMFRASPFSPGNETFYQIQARQMVGAQSFETVVAAGVATSIGWTPLIGEPNVARILGCLVGTDTTGRVILTSFGGGTVFFRGMLMPEAPVPIVLPGNGYKLGDADFPAGSPKVTSDVAATIYTTLYMGLS